MTPNGPQIRYIVRAGRSDDVTGVDTLLARAFPRLLKSDYPPSVMVTAVPLISRAQPALVTCGTYYVAETEDGAILGCGGWTLRNPATGRSGGRTGSIRHFATDPDHTRQGIAAALMARVILDATDAGMTGLDCLSTRTAVPFYAAQGFDVRGEAEIALSDGIAFPVILMYRPI